VEGLAGKPHGFGEVALGHAEAVGDALDDDMIAVVDGRGDQPCLDEISRGGGRA
jgi:hypothetical protein